MVRHALTGQWHDKESLKERQLSNMSLGVVGFGRLGKMTVRFGSAFCKKVLVCDKKPSPEIFQGLAACGIEHVDFETLLRQSDAISIHINMTPENFHLFDSAAFSKMKKGAVLINTSRGDIIDEQALIHALDSGRIKCLWSRCTSCRVASEYGRQYPGQICTKP